MELNCRSRQKGISTLGLKDKIKQIIMTNDPPKKVALSFAVGIFIGMSPFLGLHTIIGIAIAWICNLNKFVTIAGVYITNPWTVIPIYTFSTWVGAKLLGIQQVIPDINWNEASFYQIAHELKFLLLPFFLGSTVLAIISGLAGYIIIYRLMSRHKKKVISEPPSGKTI